VLTTDGQTVSRRSLVPLRRTGHRPALFCVPGHFGTVLCFEELAQHLGPDQPVYGLEARGLDGVEAPHTTIEAMAAAYLDEILDLQPTGPFFLVGYCFGGRVAFEMARQLVAGGHAVGLLALLDSYGPGTTAPGVGGHFLRRVARRLSEEAEHLALLGPRDRLAYAVTKIGRVPARVAKRFERALGLASAADGTFHRVAEAHRRAVRAYRPAAYPGPAVLFRAGRDRAHRFIDPSFGWGGWVAGGLTVRVLPGGPGAVIRGQRARALADALGR
jgi:thioesterase domain-containing protein